MSGEFLRAVLTENDTFSTPGFYTMEAVVPNPVPTTFFSVVMQAKQDRWFLIMSLAVFKIRTTDRIGGLNGNLLVELFDPATGKVFDNIPSEATFWGGGVNSALTMTEYILLEPSDLIGFRFKADTTTTNPIVSGDVIQLTMSGVEYAMKGNGNGAR